MRPDESPPTSGPIGFLLRVFSSIWLGVSLLLVLFIYSSIGSAGVPVHLNILRPDAWRNVREIFDLSEFEWFHTTFFLVLIALICINITVATLRRIRFSLVNLGVWMIHTGIIVLCAGSVWYFGSKVEGDTPVARRMIRVEVPGHPAATLIATPGAGVTVGSGNSACRVRVQSITPDWELLSGEDKGRRAYKVSVAVETPRALFIRELLAGYPQYTEDLVPSQDERQPFARARNVLGKPIVDDQVSLTLDYASQEWFYLMEGRSLYVRLAGETEWIERPLEGLPVFNDRVSSARSVWEDSAASAKRDELEVRAQPLEDSDHPLAKFEIVATDYLRYAEAETRRIVGGDQFDPAANVTLTNARGAIEQIELVASDPEKWSALRGAIEFRWVNDASEIEALRQVRPAQIELTVPSNSIARTDVFDGSTAGDPRSLGAPGFTYQIKRMDDDIRIGERVVSVAIVEITEGTRTWTRWVFDDPSLTRDVPEDGSLLSQANAALDERIGMKYLPGKRSAIRLLAGPEKESLTLLSPATADTELLERYSVVIGKPITLAADISLTVDRYSANTRLETRPRIVPPSARLSDMGLMASMVRVRLGPESSSTGAPTAWLPFHRYPFERAEDVLRRYPWRPESIKFDDGTTIEIMFSRPRQRLPQPVGLEEFVVDSHVGGFTGDTASILNWRSRVVFQGESGWGEPIEVSVNDPREHEGLWYFQAQWDPPDQPRFEGDPGSAGLNYTVLGVANRHGVNLQLLGCCLSVAGMLYVFYVKPWLQRRRVAQAMERAAVSAPRVAARGEEVSV